ncbi:pyridoxine 4-dehydrogenase [Emericellopsis cladophorae]|uniref:Pyridoxine 4-dehydrogenase n=1 Tax=Emericellopsis cladophorae TaxID=2686198 RepID=A0A9P9Y5Z8_9HYPO|nr:pyridoxine 4-dehydrogenase [Emericellopsis cladophorae]KAI6783698.1 pyridoxine 4-dehydrogenase [Emericellopsis cladophorae]
MTQVAHGSLGPIGYGLMGLTWRPNPVPVSQAIEAMKQALDSGANLWNGGEFYGTPEYNSMTLLNKYFTEYPEDADKVTLVIKGGVDTKTLVPDGSPEFIRKSVDNILAQLGGKKKLDVFGLARRDKMVPLATTLRVLQEEYVDTGKIGGIALSECSAETIHEATKTCKIAMAEVELSMFSQDTLQNGVAAACAQHDILLMAYSPIGRGILTGRFRSAEDAKHLGMVGSLPRFQDDAMAHNLKLVDQIQAVADKKGCTPAQLALAWVRSIGKKEGMPLIIPIPGSTTASRVKENSTVVELDGADLQEIEKLLANFEVKGGRYPPGVPTTI